MLGRDPPRLVLLPAEPHPNRLLHHDAGTGTIQDLVLHWRREGERGGVGCGEGKYGRLGGTKRRNSDFLSLTGRGSVGPTLDDGQRTPLDFLPAAVD